MRGDFSAWNKDRSKNFRGTLHQQGRVLLDRDWNAQTEIFGEWQETAARDAFGAGVAAVPADVPESFKITGAEITGGKVKVSLKKGRVWADGLLAELFKNAEPPAGRLTATYLGPPVQPSPLPDGTPSVGDRDAVILETWLEELSPFQRPDLLVEPALGGVDTTERVQTAFRLRLFRMSGGQTCDSIIDDLGNDFSKKGKLTVDLNPATDTGGDCPVVESGGFTGFEHRLYRIEIADTKHAGQSWFKWSHFNGGLVGTGDFDAAARKVAIHGNKNAIVHSGSNSFYLEALEFSEEQGCWKVAYGAKATLAPDGTIALPDPATAPGDIFKGAIPAAPSKGKQFFRLWNGIGRINDFTASAPKKDLPDNLGIRIQFDPEALGKYSPSDFWTFEVRAGDIGNPPILIDNRPPQGIFYHRVPLAEVNWVNNNPPASEIEDCRRPFQPLTKLKTCCTYRVGDGVNSHGDFTKIQDAIDALPKSGGEVCILPGLYEENIVLAEPHNRNIILKGCGRRTVIRATEYKEEAPGNAAIYVRAGQNITIESLAVEAHVDGMGIFLEGVEPSFDEKSKESYLKDITLCGLFVTAVQNTAIKGHIAQFLTLSNSVVYIEENETSRRPAVYFAGDDMQIERNEIRVIGNRARAEKEKGLPDRSITNDLDMLPAAQEALGGLQIGGGSERVRIIDNLIINGTGNGISLGSIDLLKDEEIITNHDPFKPKDLKEDCCNPDDGHEDENEVDENGFRAIAGPPLYDILIKFNRILNMGRNGIGVATFFSMGDEPKIGNVEISDFMAAGGMIFVSDLVICENQIERCVNVPPLDIPPKMAYLMGYGGISLSFVEGLVIRDNFIVDNCADITYPICGIFVMAALGTDISRNEITEHLPQDYGKLDAGTVRIGPRGGIWLFIAIGQMDLLSGSKRRSSADLGIFREASGAHAVKMHENVVSTPLGRPLTMTIIGDISVLGNRFTSYGIVPINIFQLFMSIVANKGLNMSSVLQILDLLAGNILIFDLGTFVLYKEFKQIGALATKGQEMDEETGNTSPNSPAGANANVSASMRVENADVQVFNLFTRAGLIHFSDNQCKLNPQNQGISIGFSSILIVGIADCGFQSNQVSCNIPRSLLITDVALLGGTLRATGNWIKETFAHVAYSGMTMGMLNSTTDNESVHCLLIVGTQFVDRFNLVLGAVPWVKGDMADDGGERLRELCKKQQGLSFILSRMWVAIMQDIKKPDTQKNVEPFIRTKAGG